MFRSKTHKHLNIQRHHDAGHMMRVAAFTVISCLIATSCSVIHTTAKHAPVVTNPTLDDTVPMVSAPRTDDTVLVGASHDQSVADHPLPSPITDHNTINEGPTDAHATETTPPDPLATTVLASSTTTKAESTKRESAKASSSKSSKASSSRSSKASSSRSKGSNSKHHKSKKHKASHTSSQKHGKEKHATPKYEKHDKHDKAHKKSKSSKKGRTASKPSKSKKDSKSSKDNKHRKSSKHSKDTKHSKDSKDSAKSTTSETTSAVPASADAPIIVPEAAIADADTDADTVNLSQVDTTGSFPAGPDGGAAIEPQNLNNAALERQQKLDKMLTTTTYIAIIAFLLILLLAGYLYFKHAMREIKKTQRLANEARAIAKDAQNIAEQQSSSPAPSGQGAPIVDRRATEALKQAQERTQQKVDQLQNVLTDVRASLGGLIRQATGHEEALSQLKNDVGDTKQQVEETKQQVDETKQQVNAAQQQVNVTQQQIIDNTHQTDATKERLDLTAQSLAAATLKIDAINEELAKFKEEMAEYQTAISQINSTHKPSKKTASPTLFEQDLFTESSHESQPAVFSSEFSASQPTTEVHTGATANPPEEDITTPATAIVTAAPAPVSPAAIDVAKAKEAPVPYTNSLAAQYPVFFKNMDEYGSALTKRDRALSTLIALGVEREQLQDIFGLTRESLKAARYRIRTKLQLERRDNLDDFLKHWL